MTIYFSGHEFKYEVEGVCKLFFPLERFEFVYDAPDASPEGTDWILTGRQKNETETRLWARISRGGETRERELSLSNGRERYETECERTICLIIFELLSDWLGVRPEWGILTGVRPVNVIQRERRAGKTDAEIKAFFTRDYLVSPEKLELALCTAEVQAPVLASLPPRSYSLYVAIPFCTSRCSYCSFVSQEIARKQPAEQVDCYVELLCAELAATAELAERLGLSLDSVYIGGGTPTALTAPQLARVMRAVAAHFDISAAREYTVEAGRADTITPEKLAVIRENGAGRISVNPQTFNDEVLREIGRRHTAAQAEEAYALARSFGFDAINMDFIAGLPGDTPESFRATIDRAVGLAPENITVHTLTVKRNSDLFQREDIRGALRAGQTAEMTDYAQKALIKAGYRPYYLYRQKNTVGNLENVGFALPGAESCYNIYIMDEIQTILACGAGGVTKLVTNRSEAEGGPIRRIFNYKYHFEYINRFDEILRRKRQAEELYGQH